MYATHQEKVTQSHLKEHTSVPEALLLTFLPGLSQIISVDMTVPHRALVNTQHSHLWNSVTLYNTHSSNTTASLLLTFHSLLTAGGAAAPSCFGSDGSALIMWWDSEQPGL